MVFDSQVLEYLQNLKTKASIDDIELIVFRHEKNLLKKEEVEKKIHKFVDKCKTFWSFPVLSMLQLIVNSIRLKVYVYQKYSKKDKVAVICRGDLAAYIGSKAFRNMPNSRILFDNRGLAIEESEMRYKNKFIHKINRMSKKRALLYAKSHCDMYNFVTNPMRNFFVEKYGYSPDIPYTIIPTLYKAEEIDEVILKEIKLRENYSKDDYIVSYIGSTVAWQSTGKLIQLIKEMNGIFPQIRFFILTNGQIPEINKLSDDLKKRIVVKGIPHCEMKYYLHISNVGIVIRNNNIINKVAAPTKVAEYLTSGIRILYSGELGIIEDLKEYSDGLLLVNLESDKDWINKIGDDIKNRRKYIDQRIINYFDMNLRQNETISMMNKSFKKSKVR